MKKFLSMVLALLCALLPMAALAQEATELSAEVPTEHSITINCGKHGSVKMDGVEYSGTFVVKIERRGTLKLTAVPDKGYEVSKISASNKDGFSVKGAEATLSEIYLDNTVKVTFASKAADDDKKDDTSDDDKNDDSGDVPGDDSGDDSGDDNTGDENNGQDGDQDSDDKDENQNTDENETAAEDAANTAGKARFNALLNDGGEAEHFYLVFDGEYAPLNYEMLNIRSEDDAQGNVLLVCAGADENGEAGRRSLILSAEQIASLSRNSDIAQLLFENGAAFGSVDLSDLLNENVQKLMSLILTGEEEISEETLKRDWSAMEAPELTEADLSAFALEVCIEPVEAADGSIAYAVKAYLRWEGMTLEISELLPSFRVNLIVDEMVNEENFETFTQSCAIGYRAADAEETVNLESTLRLLPDELPETQKDEAERFSVTVADEAQKAFTAYDANVLLTPYRHYVLSAAYAGAGVYAIAEIG